MEAPSVILQSNPKAGYLARKAEIDRAIARVMDSGWYILGREVEAFEDGFAAYLGVPHALGVANGTDAVELSLRALGIGPGDAVLTVSHTAVATVAAIERAGARPVFVDIDPVTCTMDPNCLERTLRLRGCFDGLQPRAVIPVHIYGHVADMPAICEIAQRLGLSVIEDCAQAHGALLNGQQAGAFGDLAAFSFYPTKNLGAFGDGGMIATSNDHLADRIRALREYGWRERYISFEAGVNSRLDELQAAILAARLPSLDADNAARRKHAAVYSAALVETGLRVPHVADGVEHVYHQYVVRTENRDGLREFLRQARIGTAIHYPAPVHLQPAYRDRVAGAGGLPQTERLAAEILSLPMYPQLTDAEVGRVCDAIRAWATEGRGRIGKAA